MLQVRSACSETIKHIEKNQMLQEIINPTHADTHTP
jgi:hypothetical protein